MIRMPVLRLFVRELLAFLFDYWNRHPAFAMHYRNRGGKWPIGRQWFVACGLGEYAADSPSLAIPLELQP